MILNNDTLAALEPRTKRYLVSDSDHPGFTCKVIPDGRKVLYYRYREGKSIVEKALGEDWLRAFQWYLALHQERMSRKQQPPTNPLLNPQISQALPTDTIFLDGIDLPTLCKIFMRDHVVVNLSRNTEVNYRRNLDTLLTATRGSPFYRGMATVQESRLEIKKVLLSVKERAPIGMNRLRTCLSSCFGFGVEQDLISMSPVYRLPSVKENPKHRLLQDTDLKLFFKTLGDSSHAVNTVDGLYLVLLTAMRAGELLSIRPSMVNLEEKRLILPTTKNGQPHLVALPDLAVKLLEKHLPLVHHDNRIFTTSIYGLRQVCTRASERASVTIVTPHDLRRTNATLAGKLGVSTDIISRLLNHTAVGVTRRHYALYEAEKERREALELIANHLVSLGMVV